VFPLEQAGKHGAAKETRCAGKQYLSSIRLKCHTAARLLFLVFRRVSWSTDPHHQ
jgi:hypothetical protein